MRIFTTQLKIPHMTIISKGLFFFSPVVLSRRETSLVRSWGCWVETGLASCSHLSWVCSPLGLQNSCLNSPPPYPHHHFLLFIVSSALTLHTVPHKVIRSETQDKLVQQKPSGQKDFRYSLSFKVLGILVGYSTRLLYL